MTWKLRTLAALTKNQCSVPSTYTGAHKHLNSSSNGFNTFFWPLWAPGTCVVYTRVCRQTLAPIQ